jgi:hypothetical protein
MRRQIAAMTPKTNTRRSMRFSSDTATERSRRLYVAVLGSASSRADAELYSLRLHVEFVRERLMETRGSA